VPENAISYDYPVFPKPMTAADVIAQFGYVIRQMAMASPSFGLAMANVGASYCRWRLLAAVVRRPGRRAQFGVQPLERYLLLGDRRLTRGP
jgi:hypothetical protein